MVPGINNNGSNSSNPLADLPTNNSFVSQQTFLTLLVTQLKNQDPLNPQDSSQFVSQLASFSALEQMTQQNKSISTLLESSITNLIGKTVTVADPNTQSGFTQGVVTGIVYYKDGPAVSVNGQDYSLKAVQNVTQ
jgi:flagellar basal-body rod modification protein FlgD